MCLSGKPKEINVIILIPKAREEATEECIRVFVVFHLFCQWISSKKYANKYIYSNITVTRSR